MRLAGSVADSVAQSRLPRGHLDARCLQGQPGTVDSGGNVAQRSGGRCHGGVSGVACQTRHPSGGSSGPSGVSHQTPLRGNPGVW